LWLRREADTPTCRITEDMIGVLEAKVAAVVCVDVGGVQGDSRTAVAAWRDTGWMTRGAHAKVADAVSVVLKRVMTPEDAGQGCQAGKRPAVGRAFGKDSGG